MRDPRIRMIEFDATMGPFFAIDLVMRTSACDFVLLQDADDWSSASRADLLSRELVARPQTIAATSAQLLHDDNSIIYESLADRLGRPFSPGTARDRFRHHGLYNRPQMLLRGGYFGGFKYAFDAYITGMLYLTNSVTVLSSPLYNRRMRAGSLTRSAETGMRTPRRASVTGQLEAMIADLATLQQPAEVAQIARTTTRFLAKEHAAERDNLARRLLSADWRRPELVSVPALLRDSLIQ